MIKVTRKDLVSWVVKKQGCDQGNCCLKKFLFPLRIFFNEKHITTLVLDNALSEEIVETAATGS